MHFDCKVHTFSFRFIQWGHCCFIFTTVPSQHIHFRVKQIVTDLLHSTLTAAMWSVYLITCSVQPILRPHHRNNPTRHCAWVRTCTRDTVLHLFAGVLLLLLSFYIVFICLSVLLVILLFHSNTRFKWAAWLKLTGLSVPAILKEKPPSNQIFAGIYSPQGHAMTFQYSKWE